MDESTPQLTEAVRIRDMPWPEFMKMLRGIGPEMGRLADRGDPTARRVLASYKYAADHPKDVKANQDLRAAVEDYINRDLRLAEQIDLGGKYGHRLPEAEKDAGPRILVPEGIKGKS
jgi:hypothetical protein